ncbi:MAG: hypothetical protein CL422_11965 [Acidimicrobiaceae bacterium]|nr:hypothetical protein [Acidimicrobiaceae bacterium]
MDDSGDGGPGPMAGGAKDFFFAARPPMDDGSEGPLSDDEMFAGFRGVFGSDGSDGPARPMDLDDDAFMPPMGDDGPADRGEMFKKFGFDDDAPRPGTDGGDDEHRGFMSFDDEGRDGGEGGLNQFFMAGPGGEVDDSGDGGPGPMAGGAKDFFFSKTVDTTGPQKAEPTPATGTQSVQETKENTSPSFFNSTETAGPAEKEVPTAGFFKRPDETAAAEDEQASKSAFFANVTAPVTTSSSTTRPSFFNPGGATNPFFGGSSNTVVRTDSELERDSEQQFETNNDSDGRGAERNDRNDETEARASN